MYGHMSLSCMTIPYSYNLKVVYLAWSLTQNVQSHKCSSLCYSFHSGQSNLGEEFSYQAVNCFYYSFATHTFLFNFTDIYHNKLWEILKEMGIPDHLTCLLRNLYAGQEAIVRTGHGTTDWFQIGKGVCQGYILSLCLFNFYAEYIMRNAGLEEVHRYC